MRETQAQIKKYQARLPHMREKLAMVAMLFVMSTVMLTSATFAWFVLSHAVFRIPEFDSPGNGPVYRLFQIFQNRSGYGGSFPSFHCG